MFFGDILCIVIEIILCALLYLLAEHATKVHSRWWRLCYALPVLWVLVCVEFYGVDICMLPAYLGATLLLIGFFKEKAHLRKLVSILSIVAVMMGLLLCLNMPSYRAPDYAQDFEEGFEKAKTYYLLSEHKQIDWDGLYKEYLPRFEEAAANYDEVAATVAWTEFAMEFHDGHVSYSPKDDKMLEQAHAKMYGKDFGLSLIELTDEMVVAVNVEPGSITEKVGIENGTVITSWDGMVIDEAIEKASETMPSVYGFATEVNEKFYRALTVAGMGKGAVKVGYLDATGKEQEAKLIEIGDYSERLMETVEILDAGVDIGNLEWKEIDEKTALLRLRMMFYDAQAHDDKMAEEVREKLLKLKENGVNNLIIDLRSNGGGSGMYVKHLLKLIAPKGEHVYAYDGVFDKELVDYLKETDASGKEVYKRGYCNTYQGEDLWSHGKIIILVNAQTVSAGDHLTKLASAYPNVTVMGFTHTNCSAQGPGMVTFDYGAFSYSSSLLLNEDGSVFIDTDASRQPTIGLDVQIPLDAEAVKAIFTDGEDYVLEKAMEYLEEN